AAGKHRDGAVRLDPHRHLGADQAETFGTDAPGHQTPTGDANLGFWRACDDAAVGIAHHDVAKTQLDVSVGIPLELSAADLDVVVAAELLLDRRGKPGRRDIEPDWTAG